MKKKVNKPGKGAKHSASESRVRMNGRERAEMPPDGTEARFVANLEAYWGRALAAKHGTVGEEACRVTWARGNGE